MSFKELHLTDFQSHASTQLELGQFTVFAGPSSSGKSAVVRALKAVCLGSSSTGLTRAGAKAFRVRLVADDGYVERSDSTYVLHTNDKDVEFRKCGRSIPEPVADFVGVTDLNFGSQHDLPLLVDTKPAATAKELEFLTGADKIGAAVATLESEIRADKAEERGSRGRIKDLDTQAKLFKIVPDLTERVTHGISVLDKADQFYQLYDVVSAAVERVMAAEDAVVEHPGEAPEFSLAGAERLVAGFVEIVDALGCIEVAEEKAQRAVGAERSARRALEQAERELEQAVREIKLCESCPFG